MPTNFMEINWAKGWGWLLLWGVVLVALGLTAISLSTLTTVISVILIGSFLVISGIVVILDAYRFWQHGWGAFFLLLLMGILYLGVGATLIVNPLSGSISLTLILGLLYLLLGIFRIIYSISIEAPKRGWSLFSGILSLLLGILILSSWPASGLYIIGLFVGIDLLVWGWTYILIALTGRSLLMS